MNVCYLQAAIGWAVVMGSDRMSHTSNWGVGLWEFWGLGAFLLGLGIGVQGFTDLQGNVGPVPCQLQTDKLYKGYY